MADKVLPGPVANGCNSGGSVNIHTNKILDACRDKDCIDDLRVFPTVSSQSIIDSAFSVRPDSASLIYADVNVDAISFNRGYYTVDVTFFYHVKGSTFPGGLPVQGLAVFDKRVILYGSEGSVKSFSSRDDYSAAGTGTGRNPVAVVDAVDPIALNLRIADSISGEDTELRSIPTEIAEHIGEPLNLTAGGKRLYVTLGQFSMIRLEREFQLSLGHAENFFPDQECIGSGGDDPCALFSRVRFPMEEFYPPETISAEETYRNLV